MTTNESASEASITAPEGAAASTPNEAVAMTSDIWPMTERKTRDINSRGYAHTGYVLQDEVGDRAIVEHSKVRWLNPGEWDVMMSGVIPATPNPDRQRTTPETPTERAAFEARFPNSDLRRDATGGYVDFETFTLFYGWNARAESQAAVDPREHEQTR